MIRIPHSSIYALTAKSQAVNSARLAAAEEQAITGRRINRPSDAPSDLSEVHHLDDAAADQEVYKDNSQGATSILNTMDGALGQAADVIVRAREIAIAMAGDTSTPEGRAAAAVEVRQLQNTMLDLANTSYAGRYVFAGDAYHTQPFTSTGTYSGSTTEPSAQVSQTTWVRTGLDGSSVFNGSVDVFGTLDALAVALETNSAAGVSATISDLDLSTTALGEARGEVGSETNAAEDALNNAESLGALFSERLEKLVNIDPVEAYTVLTELRNAYSATMQVAGSASTRSLLDYLS